MKKPALYESIKPLHIAAKLLGFLVFTVDDEKFTPKFKFCDIFFILSGISSNFLMNYIYWTTIFDFVFERSSIINISIPFITLSQNIIVITITIAGFFKIHKVCDILRKFSEIDEEFGKCFNIKIDYEKQKQKAVKLIVSMSLMVIVIVLIRYTSNLIYSPTSSIKTNIYYFMCFCGSTVLLLSFKFAALGVKMRFENVNKCLRSSLNYQELSSHQLKKLAKIHMKITDIIQLINQTFSLALMLYFIIFFCWCCMYCFLIVSTSKEVWLNYSGYILLRLTANIFIDGLMFNAIRTASLAEMEGIKTARILFEIRIDKIGETETISSFIDQVKFTSMKFSCGLFSYDWKFLFKFLSAVIMYVIFMMQFDSSIRGSKICSPNNSTNSV
ncbi:hypothetical protein PVAND_000667 [Polypedilum vanderplanki]|uniref:Gustatory receptor n=1 Tax=Polypedilum vanderplanki TaxID=319348 RepID=A0A9J6BLA5_POLVA|nr:hypothetical protein PVAND_000667 [Polypedilum vanderplanki]